MILLAACAEPRPEATIDAERRRVRAAEAPLLLSAATAALDAGRLADAARAVAMGLEVDRERFLPLVDRLASEPAAAAVLADARDPVAERFRGTLPAPPSPPADGVTLARGEVVLAGVLAEYVVEPDPAAMAAGASRRLAARGAPPADGDVLARIRAAIGHGVAEPVAVVEGVGGALAALDPYTLPVWPAQLGAWEEHHAGVSVGVGVVLADAPDGRVVVELPEPGGPAWKAGVHAGDVVIGVDADLGPRDAAGWAARLAGPPGSPVELVLADRRVPLVRGAVPEVTVRAWRRTAEGWDPWVAPGIALVHVSAFRPHTDEELDTVLDGHAPAAVILDLRGNGGGDVMAAVNVADRFVADGALAALAGRTIPPPAPGPNGELPWNAAVPGHALEGVPVVVLVDRDTASAAEIVAGALRERAGAVLVGERTFGKGLSQALRVDAGRGVGWQVTNGTWTLPSGAALQQPGGERTGLEPDVEVHLSPGERMLVAEMRARRELPPVHPDGTPVPYLGTVARPELPRLSLDPQVVEALLLAQRLAHE